ncbi:MAG TPA: hypothetical protein DDW76_22335 [Cyanobacteria bacterium UBA11369]|nr:hypothetical protein [Cyanobacteria bacterium UBA11371]HBE32842.1 hypothetical protein [Cyanobacteria bacterium UBA11368]HBE51438.1 hypothetical protein [Cyanobacteria bacterium UBA11369]
MNFLKQSRQFLTAIALILVLTITTACAGPSVATQKPQLPSINQVSSQLQRGNTSAGQKYGDWVVQTAKGLVKDAYVRDNNKLGVVIAPQVKPTEVRDLARSLVQGFHNNFPNQDVSVLVYGPDKHLILTAQYDHQSNQVKYQANS